MKTATSCRVNWQGMLLVGLFGLAACSTPSVDTAGTQELAAARAQMLEHLQVLGIRDARVLRAMGRVPRHEFVRPEDRKLAYADQALPIGGGHTISQPYIVALMTELLQLRGDERVLEIGTGSGYQAAAVSLLTREVYSIEIDATLADTARQRLQRLGYDKVQVRAGDGFYGWDEAAPFDAVLLTAAAPKVPDRLVAQLKIGGRLVMPLDEGGAQTLIRARKQADGLKIERFAAVSFVPMTGAVRTPNP